MSDQPTVIIQIHAGKYLGCHFTDGVRVVLADEGRPGDRLYQMSIASTPEEIAEVLGADPVGHAGDGKLSDNEIQGIRAMASRLEGQSLRVVQPCYCSKCDDARVQRELAEGKPSFPYFQVCPVCGNKRCPKGTDHDLECTGSNEPGQKGSRYE